MNEEIILKMVNPYLKNGNLTYDDFENIFCILSLKEQYKVSEILFNNGIDLIDTETDEVVLEVEREKEFAPVKNATGVDSVESARELLQKNGIEI